MHSQQGSMQELAGRFESLNDAIRPVADEAITDPILSSLELSEPRDVGLSWLIDAAVSIFERTMAAFILVLTFPALLVIALAIRLDSPGKAIFRQKRIAQLRRRTVGLGSSDDNLEFHPSINGQIECVPTFTLYKFRTYHDNSDALAPDRAKFEFDPDRIDDVRLQLKDDPRITRVGRFLRRSSLDELPNFINILKGEMRLIGPRPEVREMYRYYTMEQKAKFSVKPGITGLAQVNGRGKLNFRQTIEYDLRYVRNRSWRVDLKILAKTLKVVLTGDGSY